MEDTILWTVENIILPIGLSLIESVVKQTYDNRTAYTKEKKKLEKILRKAVDNALPKNTDPRIAVQLMDEIIKELPNYSTAIISRACEKIVSEWPDAEYYIKAKDVANSISISLSVSFYETPEFRSIIALNGINQIEKQIERIARRFDSIEERINHIPKTIEDFVRSGKRIQRISQNSMEIAEKYQSFFSKELFLERNQPDNKIAFLKDVYIENEYTPLDLYKTEIDVSLMGFIEEFANDNVLRKHYKTLYATDTGILKLLIVKGHPGSGKSSLFYALAYRKTHEVDFLPEIDFYFVKLIELYSTVDSKPSTAPLSDIVKYLGLPFPKNNCVFVLDGLDEICALTGFDSGAYCKNLARQACERKNVKVILTTRLNYVNVPHKDNKNVFNIQLKPLSNAALRKWINSYFGIHTELIEEKKLALLNIDYIENYVENKSEDIKEIVAIPLLFYMIVATSINIQLIESVGHLYDMVFSELKSRNYNDNVASHIQNHASNDLLRNELPRRVAMSIATIMYKNNNPLVAIKSKELEKSIEALKEEYRLNKKEKENLEKLFPITFYYKKRDDVVEFAHKSIMEFFAAEQLFADFCACDSDLLDYVVKYMAEPVVWGEIISFFSYFWNTRKDDRVATHYAKTIEEDFKKITSPEYALQVRGSSYSYEANYLLFKILWCLAHDILKLTDQLNSILEENYYSTYLGNILSVKGTEVSSFFDQAVHPWNFSEIQTSHISVEGGNLCGVVFDNIEMGLLEFSKTLLYKASFRHIIAGCVSFKLCEINDSTFGDSDGLTRFEFTNCLMNRVTLLTEKESDIIDLEFVRDLIRGKEEVYDFSGSLLSDVSFNSISFNKARFRRSNIKGIRLEKVLISLNQFSSFSEKGVLLYAKDIILDLRGYKLHYDEKNERIVRDEDEKESVLRSDINSLSRTAPASFLSRSPEVRNLVPVSKIRIVELNMLVGVKLDSLPIDGEAFFLF